MNNQVEVGVEVEAEAEAERILGIGRVNSDNVTIVPCHNCEEDTVWMSYTDNTCIQVEPEVLGDDSEHAIHYCRRPPTHVNYYMDDEDSFEERHVVDEADDQELYNYENTEYTDDKEDAEEGREDKLGYSNDEREEDGEAEEDSYEEDGEDESANGEWKRS